MKAWCIRDEDVVTLREYFPDVEFVYARTADEAKRAIVDVDVCFAPFLTPEMVDAAQRLVWVHSSAAAVEGLLPLRELAIRNITVTNSRGVQGVAIAEHVMGGLLVLSRKFDRTLAAQREHRWIQNELCDDWPWLLHGKAMTIVGLGAIGLEVARRAHAFGLRITGVRRRADQPRPEFISRVVPSEQIEDALHGCDILVLAAPGVGGTHRMITASRLDLLNHGAIIVNVARSQLVDGPALEDRITRGRLGGAVLDVFDEEPLDAASPLWSMPNVIVTPHSSGFRATHWDDVIALFADELKRFRTGQPLTHLVDPLAGY